MKLTEKVIAGLTCADGQKDRLVFDDTVQGLGLRISGKGGKNFIVQFRGPTGQKRRLPIGAWGGITLEQARQAARTALGLVAAGRDPFAERKADREASTSEAAADRLTLKALLSDWVAIGLAERREGYRREAVRAVSLAFKAYLNRRADSIKRMDAVQILDGLVKAGKPATASRTLAYGRACYSWAEKRGRVPSNPFVGLPIATTTASRDRVLRDEEIGAIYRGASKLGFPFGPIILLLMLTAQRRDEVAGMYWSELSNDRSTWTIPAARAKNGKAHIVSLAPAAQAILANVPVHQGSDLVFTTNGRRPASGFSRAKERLVSLIATENEGAKTYQEWRLHDFRRTCVTWLAGAGFNPAVADKILNHTTVTGMTTVGKVYQRAEYLAERKSALEAWARHVDACVEDVTTNPSSNILPLERTPRHG